MSSPTVTLPEDALRNLWERVITSALLLLLLGTTILVGGWIFVLMCLAIAILMDHEWSKLTPGSTPWKVLGIGYISIPIISALALRDLSLTALLYPVALVIAADIGGYFVGRAVGKNLLAPSISPGKTIEGLLGAMLFSGGVSLLLHHFVPWPDNSIAAIICGVLLALLAQGADLFESWLKRRKGVKDSGTILRGHGGVMDRADGYILALPIYLVALMIWAEVSV
jgi:phosphatidate cytidylyltransferase